MNNKTTSINQKTIDLNKHVDIIKYSRENNQVGQIESILIREFHHNNEYNIDNIPRINVKELSILGYKKPEKAIQNLIDRGVVTRKDDIITLVTKQVYCNRCDYERKVFVWDKEHHLQNFHYWNERNFKNYVIDLEFSSKPLPDKIDHDFKAIGELQDNKLEVKCKNCGYERTIYIDNYRKECNPNDTSVFIENPDDLENIKVIVYANHEELVFKNQEELQKFIQSKVNNGA